MLALTFQIGNDRLALDIRQVREVVPRVRLQPVTGAPPWLAGLLVYRGQVIPVVDLHHLMQAGECPPHLSSRIILVPQPGKDGDRLLGLLAAQVADVRELSAPERALPRLTLPGQPDLGSVVVDGGGVLHLLELSRLLPEAAREQLALVSVERRS